MCVRNTHCPRVIQYKSGQQRRKTEFKQVLTGVITKCFNRWHCPPPIYSSYIFITICIYSYNWKEVSSMWRGYLYCFIDGFNCQGICTYTRRIHCLFLLLWVGLFKCFNILYWKRMHKIVLKMTQFHENLAILNLQCTM